MNKVIISGNLTRDPDMHRTTGEKSTVSARFSVACQRRFKNSEGNYDADFPNVVAWGKDAEFVEKYFHKGDRIEVVGEIRTGSYTNRDGQKVYTTDVYATEVNFGGGKNNNNGAATTQKQDDDFMNVPQGNEDGLPF